MPDQDLFARYRAARGVDFKGFETTVGYQIAIEEDRVQVHLEIEERHLNVYGAAHGGVTLTLLDTVGGVQTYLLARPERMATINLATQFIGLVPLGHVVATASVDRLGKSVAHTHMALHEGTPDGPLLATAVASYRLFYHAG